MAEHLKIYERQKDPWKCLEQEEKKTWSDKLMNIFRIMSKKNDERFRLKADKIEKSSCWFNFMALVVSLIVRSYHEMFKVPFSNRNMCDVWTELNEWNKSANAKPVKFSSVELRNFSSPTRKFAEWKGVSELFRVEPMAKMMMIGYMFITSTNEEFFSQICIKLILETWKIEKNIFEGKKRNIAKHQRVKRMKEIPWKIKGWKKRKKLNKKSSSSPFL